MKTYVKAYRIYLKIISQKWLEKKMHKKYKNHLRSYNYEVCTCTAVARCFPTILDVMILENINLSEDKIGQPPFWSNLLITL
jgi:hypothetical protein